MSWQPHQNVEGKGKRVCKIRKRGCSSSSSSSLIQKYRFKRAILVQKRAGSTTPVPTWITATTKSPSLAIPSVEFPSKGSPKNVSKTKEGSVSARKLAATLWESNKIPSPQAMEDLEKKDRRRKPPIVAKMPHSLSDPSYTPISEKMDRPRIKAHKRRSSVVSPKLQLTDLDSVGNASLMEIEAHSREEKAAWKRKERERTRDAIACVAEELEVEKKLRRQTERLNKKLGKELADINASLSKATKELKSEKRAKEILEQVCDELAKGMGEDRATAEELKRETAKVREEVEKEREMLHFADVLREERVQMKLSEAKHHFEEKNAVVEKLRNELATYLGTKIDGENGNGSPNLQRIKELEAYLKNINFGNCQAAKKDVDKGEVMVNGEECEADDSADSDLHSIELNMDNNDKSYNWSYASGNRVEGESKRIPTIRKENKGTKSRSEKLSWGSICLERGSSDSADWDYEDEIKRYKSVKSLRDHILSSNKIAPIGGFSSPTRQWSQSMHFQEPCSNGLPVLKGDDLKQPKVVSTRGEGRTSIS
ncbi:hypothetical protein E1A91_D05G085900v1 [Gossypium mustelinum]|uniref:Uncharacterized protein n=1 Tax=Gossypium mustelinum TaxID=34275 RepID=A0A5D2UWC3_GOSMU|nr:hypothetical protein E1A91_D05G085900v1 [Gossypium mustelinum]